MDLKYLKKLIKEELNTTFFKDLKPIIMEAPLKIKQGQVYKVKKTGKNWLVLYVDNNYIRKPKEKLIRLKSVKDKKEFHVSLEFFKKAGFDKVK